MTPHRAAHNEVASHLRLLSRLIGTHIPHAAGKGYGGPRYELHTLRETCEQIAEELEASTVAEIAAALRRGKNGGGDAEAARA